MAAYRTLVPEDILTIKECYGFATIPTAKPIAEGVENSNYLLEYSTFEKENNRAILTLFEKRVPKHDIPFFLHLKTHLYSKHIPCPLPYHTKTGDIMLPMQDTIATVVSFLDGKSIEIPDTKHCMQAGEMLAKLHMAAQDSPLHRANSMSFKAWDELRSRIEVHRNHITTIGLLDRIDMELAFARQHWPHTLPKGIIHADFFPNNVFFNNDDQLCGVIDFYFACNDLLAYDLAIVLNAWCFDKSAQFNPTLYSAVINGYESVRPLSHTEKEALPVLLRVAALRFLLTRLHDLLYHDPSAFVIPHDPLHYARILNHHTAQT